LQDQILIARVVQTAPRNGSCAVGSNSRTDDRTGV